ncbi:hypothetical protein KO525_18230 [Psychrosphaera sp. B3R10]|uniref:hypothetical protein n=1 Tax=unclassified Psychrosphaera TaxID=2641570 RepID=UPI001C0882E9|nr:MULTISPECIES: hypothetical protein [unclassified Psychrosphaera]MBU2882926.1 hypothetical protein [Psychrosphaera sp. I2R16]MBU2991323.1 hypothetical protein [Psychrosphaera sp. B3R10]
MSKFIIIVTLIFSLFFSHSGHAVEKFVELQTGSLMGMAHISFGLTLHKNHNFSIGIGFVPELDSHEEMTLTSLKYRYEGDTRIESELFGTSITISPFNFGLASLIGHQDEIYKKSPDYLPDGYYFPTAKRVIFNYQTVVSFNSDLQVYMDWSVLDVGLINYVRNFEFYNDNYDAFGLEGIVSYGFGIRKRF